MNKYEAFRSCHSMCKEDILLDIDETIGKILKHAETDPDHSYAYYTTLKKLLDKFKEAIKTLVFMEKLDDGWCYDWGVTYAGAELQLLHYDVYDGYPKEHQFLNMDQMYIIYTVPTSLLTVEEFASLHGVEVVTVRQWIRRGKIRTAKKCGNEWRIPALTDTPKRGYTSAFYKWSDTLTGLPSELEYLNNYKEASFMQDDDDKKLYYVRFFDEEVKEGVREAKKTLECNSAEREKIELAIISQPSVVYLSNFRDNICIDLMHICEEEIEENDL